MKSRRSARRGPAVVRPIAIGFTAIDEAMASPVNPFPAGRFADRIEHTRACLASVEVGACSVYAWAVLCSAANEMEAAIALGFVDDPEGLLADTFAALRACAPRFTSASALIGLPPEDVANLTDMVDGWVEFLTTHSARRVVKACRFTDARVLDLARGKLKMGDLVCSMTEGGVSGQEGAARG